MEFWIPLRIHPIFVHFALALTVVAITLDALAFWLAKPEWHRVAKLNLFFGVAGIAAAVLAGWFDHTSIHAAAHTHAEDMSDYMEIHQWLGWTLLAGFSGLLFWRSRPAFEVSRAYLLVAALALAGILVQGHIGGQLVFLGGTGVARAATPAPSGPHEGVAEHGGVRADQNDLDRDPEPTHEEQKDARHDHSQHEHAH